MKDLNIYFHIPYCKAKCRFCSFYVIPGRKSKLNEYFDCLEKEILSYKTKFKDYNIKSIFAGGGTPSLVESIYVCNIINLIKNNFNIDPNCEISIECNPETIELEKIENYLLAGVNRISIGLQSTNNTTLKFLGRLYTFEEFKEKYAIVKNSKIKNINLDLIFGIPNQTLNEWITDLNNVISLNPTHVSTYSLEIDEDSIFGYLEKKGKFKRASEKLDRDMYKKAIKILSKNDFNQYEVSNFSKNGFECIHNLSIWNGGDYIGFGASSHSRVNKERFNNVNSIEEYIELINLNKSVKENILQLSSTEQINERIVLNLRINRGVDLEALKLDFKFDLVKEKNKEIEKLKSLKLIKIVNKFLKLTPKGLDLENFVGSELIV